MIPDRIELDWIARWAMYSPKNCALQCADTGMWISYESLNTMVNKTAYSLESKGISHGERVAVLSMNRVEYVVLFFAIQKIGAIMVPLNYRLAQREIKYQLEDSSASLLIFENEYAETAKECENLVSKTLNFDGKNGLSDYMFKTETTVVEYFDHRGKLDDTCMILYTSGTTGKPKGAQITNKMLFWNSVNTSLRLNLTQQEVILTFAPFFHTGGWNVLTTPVFHRGGKVILIKKFDPDRILSLCESEKVSILFGVPTMMDMMAQSPVFEKVHLESVRYAIVGGEPMPKPLIETWHEKGIPIRQGYGLTEFGPNVFSLNEADAIRKIGSVGFPNFYIETKVVDDSGREVSINEIGELWLKGPVCTPGYWNNEEATKKSIQDGWMKTGDLVRRDDERYFYIVDRKKDMFISGAENVYPAEIEHFLRTHPNVKEVAVIGVPDAKWGEVGKACIVRHDESNDSEEDFRAFCIGNLAKYKIPKYFTFLSELPKSDSGKILKRALKEHSE